MGERPADVVVVGAGVVGALAAYRLAARGHRVTVVEKTEPCRGATGATFAWTSAHSKEPLFYHRFNFEGIARYKPLGEELGVDFWWHPCFSIRPVFEEASYEEASARVRKKREEGYRLSWVEGEEARRLVPLLSPDAMGASLCEGEGSLDSFRLVFAALHRARERGVEVRCGEEVVAIERSGGRVSAVRTSRGTIPCQLVVNAAGAQAPEVGRLAGAPIPFRRVKGEILLTEKFPPLLRGVVADIRQTYSGNFMIGATQEPERLDTLSTLPNLARLAQNARRILPSLRSARVIRAYAGVRPFPADGVSVLGPTRRCEGFLWATTHSGITLGALVAEVIADFAEGRHHPCWDERFSPDRFEEAAP